MLRQLVNEGVSPWLSEWTCAEAGWDAARCLAEEQGFLGFFAPAVVPHFALRAACDSLRPAFERSGGRHGQVSASLSPPLANDAFALVAEVAALHRSIQRPNVLVRLPASPSGLAALSGCVARGLSVDVTPVFSAEHYGRVLTAYLNGLDRALASGLPLEGISLLASVPVGLIDTAVNSRLPGPPAGPLRDAAGVATAQLIYRVREERLATTWWSVLRSAGAAPPRIAWTGARSEHVGALVGANTVLALTAETLENVVRENVLQGDTLLNAYHDGRRVLTALKGHGVDMADVAEALERETCSVEPTY